MTIPLKVESNAFYYFTLGRIYSLCIVGLLVRQLKILDEGPAIHPWELDEPIKLVQYDR